MLDYSKVFAHGVVKSPDESDNGKVCPTPERNAEHRNGSPSWLQRKFRYLSCRDGSDAYGTNNARLHTTSPSRCTGRYAHGARRRRIAVSVGLLEVATNLAEQGKSPEPLYQEWIEMYASDEVGGIGGVAARPLEWSDGGEFPMMKNSDWRIIS